MGKLWPFQSDSFSSCWTLTVKPQPSHEVRSQSAHVALSQVASTEFWPTYSPACGSFYEELARWWTFLNTKMVSKEKEVFMGELAASGELSDREADSEDEMPVEVTAAPKKGVLEALGDIGSILTTGFTAVGTRIAKMGNKVGVMNNNMVLMSKNMDLNFQELMKNQPPDQWDSDSDEHDSSDADSDPLGESVTAKGSKRKHPEGDVSANEDEENGLLDSLVKDLESDSSVGLPLQEPVANFVNATFKKPLSKEEVKAKRLKFTKPANTTGFNTPKVNEAIWSKLPAGVKARDRAWQANHATFLNAVTAMARTADVLRAHEKEGPWVKEALGLSADAISICATLSADWTKTRRDDIRPVLPEDFKRLASAEIPPSASYIFGDDLEASIKSLESHNRLAKKMGNANTPSTGQKSFEPNKNKSNKDKKKWHTQKKGDRSNKSNGGKDSGRDFHKKGKRRT